MDGEGASASSRQRVLSNWQSSKAGIIVHLGKIGGMDADDDGMRVVVQYVNHLEHGDKIRTLHGTKHGVSIVADADLPYVEVTGQVADMCLSPAGIVQRQSLGMMLMASQAAIGPGIVVARLASQEAEAAAASKALAPQLLAPAAVYVG